MNPAPHLKSRLALIPAFLLLLLAGFGSLAFAGWDYGNGRHGHFVLMTNATIEQLYQTVRLPSDPAQYNPSDSNAVPNFQNLIITNGAVLTAKPWDGSAGGRIVLKVEAVLGVASGSSISANGIGFRGGGFLQQGESLNGIGGGSQTANFGGGGGAYQMPNGYQTSAGGGGYAVGGGTGGGNPFTIYNGVDYRGVGGGTYGDPTLSTIYLGSGGGGGGVFAPRPNIYSFTGGRGGGAIVLNAGNLEVNGQIQANGGIPHDEVAGTPEIVSSGGGGSVGSIVLRAKTANLGDNEITATGGGSAGGNGGSGGVGRIMVGYFSNYSGTTIPAAYTVLDTNSDNVTTITIQPASQTNYWSSAAVLTVGIAGYPPFAFQWYFNAAPISGATNQTLVLTSLDFTNQGDYSVTVSNAVMIVASSNAFLTVLDGRDFDGDGIPNYWELQHGLDPNNPLDANTYPPGDQLTYLQKFQFGLNPDNRTDTDGDGLTDYDELFIYGTNPLKKDTDGDGMPDGWEVQHGLNPLVNDANDDLDLDGLTNLQEYQMWLTNNVQRPDRPDSIGDGRSDYERLFGTQTNRFYYDRNDRLVGVDYNRGSNGFGIAYVYDGNGNLLRQKNLSRDANHNGLPDLWEFLHGLTNNPSAFADSDGDGWTDYQEWKAGSDPLITNSRPNSIGLLGSNIVSLTLPFTSSNFVMAVGPLDNSGLDSVVVGADGNPGGVTNSLWLLTPAGTGWSTQRVDIGSFGVTSLAVGQPANQTAPAIYVGLRGMTNGSGQIMEFTSTGGSWRSNLVALSTNEAAFVLGVRAGADLMASYSVTNVAGYPLFSLSFSSSAWNSVLLNTNSANRGLGLISELGTNASVPFRLLDRGGIEVMGNAPPLPTNAVYRSPSGSFFFVTPNPMTWSNAESFAQTYGGHLASIADASENEFVRSMASGLGIGDSWIGFNDEAIEGTFVWSSGEPITFVNWNAGEPNNVGNEDAVQIFISNGKWNDLPDSISLPGIIEVSQAAVFANSLFLREPSASRANNWRGASLATGTLHGTNGSSVLYSLVDDKNRNGLVDFADDFVTVEYSVSGTNALVLTSNRQSIASITVAQSYGLASVNFLNSSNEVFFTGEPDGQVFSWTVTGSTNPLQRQLFSAQYAGKAWHAMAGVKTLEPGEALVGLLVDPATPNKCDVILWPQQREFPQAVSFPQTAPLARVLPFPPTGGNLANVRVRIWDAEGNASLPFLQFSADRTNWFDVTKIMSLDSLPYNFSTRVTALPTGSDHSLWWDAGAEGFLFRHDEHFSAGTSARCFIARGLVRANAISTDHRDGFGPRWSAG